jgi:hypothetical protein
MIVRIALPSVTLGILVAAPWLVLNRDKTDPAILESALRPLGLLGSVAHIVLSALDTVWFAPGAWFGLVGRIFIRAGLRSHPQPGKDDAWRHGSLCRRALCGGELGQAQCGRQARASSSFAKATDARRTRRPCWATPGFRNVAVLRGSALAVG